MSDFGSQVPPLSPPQPLPAKPPNPLGPIEQTQADAQSAKAKIRCRFCGKAFSDETPLGRHVSEQHKGAEKNTK